MLRALFVTAVLVASTTDGGTAGSSPSLVSGGGGGLPAVAAAAATGGAPAGVAAGTAAAASATAAAADPLAARARRRLHSVPGPSPDAPPPGASPPPGVNASALRGAAAGSLFLARRFAPGDELVSPAAPRAPRSARYSRCRAAHRCAAGAAAYDARAARWAFSSTFFEGGEAEPAAAFLDFEDWRAGTGGLAAGAGGGWLAGAPAQTRGPHVSTWWPEAAAALGGPLYLNHSCAVLFDTDALLASVTCDPVPEAPRVRARRRRRGARVFASPAVDAAGYAAFDAAPFYADEAVVPVVAPAWAWLAAYAPAPAVGDRGVAVACAPRPALPDAAAWRGGGWADAAAGTPDGSAFAAGRRPFVSPAAYAAPYASSDAPGAGAPPPLPDNATAFSRVTGLPAGVSARVADVAAVAAGGAPCGAYYTYAFNFTGARLYSRHATGAASPWRPGGAPGDAGGGAPPGGLPAGAPFALFHFESLFLGPSVRVAVRGALPLVLLSRSALVLDTPLEVPPGTLGGFPGARGLLPGHANTHGPGATAVRTHTFTVTLAGTPTPEVQTLVTSVAAGQTLRGDFSLGLPRAPWRDAAAAADAAAGGAGAYFGGRPARAAPVTAADARDDRGGGRGRAPPADARDAALDWTTWLPALAEPGAIEAAIHASLPRAGNVSVTRSRAMARGGYNYTVVFAPAGRPGDVPQLRVASRLTGAGAAVFSDTLHDGAAINGTWALSWRGVATPPLRADATAEAVRDAAAAAWAAAGALSVAVSRSDPAGRDVWACAPRTTGGRVGGGPGPVYVAPRARGRAAGGPGGAPPAGALAASDGGGDGGAPPGPSVQVYTPDADNGAPVDGVNRTRVIGSAGGAGSGGDGAAGGCVNGPGPGWGVVYSITIVSHAGVVDAAAPTSVDLAGAPDAAGVFPPPAPMLRPAAAHALAADPWGEAAAAAAARGDALAAALGLPPAAPGDGRGAFGGAAYAPGVADAAAAAAAAADAGVLARATLRRVWEYNVTHAGAGGLLAAALATALGGAAATTASGAAGADVADAPGSLLFDYGARYARRWLAPASAYARALPTRPVNATLFPDEAAASVDGLPPASLEAAVDAVLAAARVARVPGASPLLAGVVGPRAYAGALAVLPPALALSRAALAAHPPAVLTVDGGGLTGAGAAAFVTAGHWGSEATGAPSHAFIRPGDSFTGTTPAVEAALLLGGAGVVDASWPTPDAAGVGDGRRAGPGPAGLLQRVGLSLSAYAGAYGRAYEPGGADAAPYTARAYDDTAAWLVTAAYGGAGGSAGGGGGEGHGPFPPRAPVGAPGVDDLLGGSGGASGGATVQEVLAFMDAGRPVGGGGAGGGAVELVATTDLVLGRHAAVRADGAPGEPAGRAGGGGAGGTVVLAAGGSVVIGGPVSARGGRGGDGVGPGGRGGGGGGGGRALALGASVSVRFGASVRVDGGPGGPDEVVAGPASAPSAPPESPDALAAPPLPPPSAAVTGARGFNGRPRDDRAAIAGGAGSVALLSASAAAFHVESAPPSPGYRAGPQGGAEETARSLRVSTADTARGGGEVAVPGAAPSYGVPLAEGGVGTAGPGAHARPLQHTGPWFLLARPDAGGVWAARRGGPVDLVLTLTLSVNVTLAVANVSAAAAGGGGATAAPGDGLPAGAALLWPPGGAGGELRYAAAATPAPAVVTGSALAVVRDASVGARGPGDAAGAARATLGALPSALDALVAGVDGRPFNATSGGAPPAAPAPAAPVPRPRPARVTAYVRYGRAPPGGAGVRARWGLHLALHDDDAWDGFSGHALGAASLAGASANVSAVDAAAAPPGGSALARGATAAAPLYAAALAAVDTAAIVATATADAAARVLAIASALPPCAGPGGAGAGAGARACVPVGPNGTLAGGTGGLVTVTTGARVRVALREGNWVPSAAAPDPDATALALARGAHGAGFTAQSAGARARAAAGGATLVAGRAWAPPRAAAAYDAASGDVDLSRAGDVAAGGAAGDRARARLARGVDAAARFGYAPPPRAAAGDASDSFGDAAAALAALEAAALAAARSDPAASPLSGVANLSAAGLPADLTLPPSEYSVVYTTGGVGAGGPGAYPDGAGLPFSPSPPGAPAGASPSFAADAPVMVGVGILNGAWVHGANYRGAPGLALGAGAPGGGARAAARAAADGLDGGTATVAAGLPLPDAWYKVDVFLDWAAMTYKVRVDDVTVALDQPFSGRGVTRLGMYVFDASTAWFDEIYAGADDTLGFECPVSTGEGEALRMRRPAQSAWRADDVGGPSEYWGESRHESHLSRRDQYVDPSHDGLVYGDGEQLRRYYADVGAAARLDGSTGDAGFAPGAGDGVATFSDATLGLPAPAAVALADAANAPVPPPAAAADADGASPGEVLAGALLLVRGDEPAEAVVLAAATDGVPDDAPVNFGQGDGGRAVDARAPFEPAGRFVGAGALAGGQSVLDAVEGGGPLDAPAPASAAMRGGTAFPSVASDRLTAALAAGDAGDADAPWAGPAHGGEWAAGVDARAGHGSEQAVRGAALGRTGRSWLYGEHDNPAHVWFHPGGVLAAQPGVPLPRAPNGTWPAIYALDAGLGASDAAAAAAAAAPAGGPGGAGGGVDTGGDYNAIFGARPAIVFPAGCTSPTAVACANATGAAVPCVNPAVAACVDGAGARVNCTNPAAALVVPANSLVNSVVNSSNTSALCAAVCGAPEAAAAALCVGACAPGSATCVSAAGAAVPCGNPAAAVCADGAGAAVPCVNPAASACVDAAGARAACAAAACPPPPPPPPALPAVCPTPPLFYTAPGGGGGGGGAPSNVTFCFTAAGNVTDCLSPAAAACVDRSGNAVAPCGVPCLPAGAPCTAPPCAARCAAPGVVACFSAAGAPTACVNPAVVACADGVGAELPCAVPCADAPAGPLRCRAPAVAACYAAAPAGGGGAPVPVPCGNAGAAARCTDARGADVDCAAAVAAVACVSPASGARVPCLAPNATACADAGGLPTPCSVSCAAAACAGSPAASGCADEYLARAACGGAAVAACLLPPAPAGPYRRRLETRPWYAGGVAACSTAGLAAGWRNEGIVLHYANVTNAAGLAPSNGTNGTMSFRSYAGVGSVVTGTADTPATTRGAADASPPTPADAAAVDAAAAAAGAAGAAPGNASAAVAYRVFRPRVLLNLRFLPAELAELFPGFTPGARAVNCSDARAAAAAPAGLCVNGTLARNATDAPAPAAGDVGLAVAEVDGGGDGPPGVDGEDPYAGAAGVDAADAAAAAAAAAAPSPAPGGGGAGGGGGPAVTAPTPADLFAALNRTLLYRVLGAEYTGSAFVMWMGADDYAATRRLAGVAVSLRPGGPFVYLWSTLPDGNETVDLSVAQDADTGRAYLVRTYYTTTTYYLPAPVMQPVWESVKGPDLATTNFALTYHRAFYSADYDNPNDIWRQRWRLENLPWLVVTGDWRETFDLASATFTLANAVVNASYTYAASARAATLALVLGRYTLRAVLGQGQRVVTTRFQDPADPANSVWRPSSVPTVRAQPWAENYRDSNVADNPTHPTVADLLIGYARVVEQRRAAFLAVSPLDWGFTNTTGAVLVLEGSTPLLSTVDGPDAYPARGAPGAGRAPGAGPAGRPALARDRLLALLAASSAAAGGLGAHFGWAAGRGSVVGAGVGALRNTTFEPDVYGTPPGSGGVFPFHTQVDAYDRFWQFNRSFGDRRLDFRNFRDRQNATGNACPDKHHVALVTLAACQAILNYRLAYAHTPAVKNYLDAQQSFSYAMDTAEYEACVAKHAEQLKAYEDCVRAAEPDFDALPPWNVNARDCVGGGGACGPPPAGADPNASYGFPPFSRLAYGLDAAALEPDLPAYNASNGTASTVPSYYGTAMDGLAPGPVPPAALAAGAGATVGHRARALEGAGRTPAEREMLARLARHDAGLSSEDWALLDRLAREVREG